MLEIKELSKTYFLKNNKIEALKDVSFSVKEGEIVALLGPNGAGKTTLIKCATGLVIPDKGDVKIDGCSIIKSPLKALKNLSVVLEGDRNLFFRLTGRENIQYFLTLSSKKVDHYEINKWAKKFGLLNMLDKEVRFYSKGMKQKLSLLISLLSPGKVILLDEPTTGLDVFSSIELRDFIKEIVNYEKAVLVATHEMHTAEEIANKVAILNRGSLLVFDEMKKFKEKFSRKIYKIKVYLRDITDFREYSFKEQGHNVFEFEISQDKASFSRFLEKIFASGGVLLELSVDEPDLEEIFVSLFNYKNNKEV